MVHFARTPTRRDLLNWLRSGLIAIPLRVVAASPRPDSKTRPEPSWNVLPAWLLMHGRAAFGNASALTIAIRDTQPPLTVYKEHTRVRLVQPPGDNSILRLRFEKGQRYNLTRLPLHGNGSFVDIGANLGFVSIAVAKLRPCMRIIAIEPAPETYFYFLWNCWLNGVPVTAVDLSSSNGMGDTSTHTLASEHQGMERRASILALNAAVVGGSDGETTTMRFNPKNTQVTMSEDVLQRDLSVFHCGRFVSGRRCFKRPEIRTISVATVNVLEFLKRRGDPNGIVQLLKMDCEGCEIAFAANSTSSLRSWFLDKRRVKWIVGEQHPTLHKAFDIRDIRTAARLFKARGCPFESLRTRQISWSIDC